MDRRLFLISAAAAGLLLYDRVVPRPLSPNGPKILAYIGARDCGYCRDFERDGRRELRSAVLARRWSWTEYASGSLDGLHDPGTWPADKRWILEKGRGWFRGTPSFVLFDDGHAARSVAGFGGVDRVMAKMA